ncbi:hypothetical protein KFU94_19155 [Chloroflexi bacterium TSY]|nr:hypothetical protein [Chloroflexi bacterium TSY]
MKSLLQQNTDRQKRSESSFSKPRQDKTFLGRYSSQRLRIRFHLILGVFVFLLLGPILASFWLAPSWNAIHFNRLQSLDSFDFAQDKSSLHSRLTRLLFTDFERWPSVLPEFDRFVHPYLDKVADSQPQAVSVTLSGQIDDVTSLKQNILSSAQLVNHQVSEPDRALSQGKPEIVLDAELLQRTPLWPNPYLAFLPTGARPEYALWEARMRTASQQRAEQYSISSAAFTQFNEVEPNNSLNSANFMGWFRIRFTLLIHR